MRRLELLGKYLMCVRKGKGLSLETISLRIGICRASLSKYEHNAGHIPISVLIELVKLYKIDLDWILDNKEQ